MLILTKLNLLDESYQLQHQYNTQQEDESSLLRKMPFDANERDHHIIQELDNMKSQLNKLQKEGGISVDKFDNDIEKDEYDNNAFHTYPSFPKSSLNLANSASDMPDASQLKLGLKL